MHRALYKSFTNIICRMHNLYIYIQCFDDHGKLVNTGAPALQWETSLIKMTYERLHMLTAQNATAAQTIVGIDDFSFMRMLKKHSVLEMLTRHTPKSLQRVHVIP